MNQQQGPQIRFITRPRASLLERIAFFSLGLIVLVAAFFFVGIALIAGVIIAGVFLIRWWWRQRKLRRETGDTCVEGEYTVVESAIIDQRPKDNS